MTDSGFAGGALLGSMAWSAAAIVVVLAVTFAWARHTGGHRVVDTAWGLLFVAVAVTTFVRSAGDGGSGRRWLLLVMTLLWGVRLAVHLGRRSRGAGEDPRYAELLAGRGLVFTIASVYLLQGALTFVVSMPIQVGMLERAPLGVLDYLGAALWLIGLGFEAVGDRQLDRYKADPDREPVLDTGLWRYTRHPNYFGDACVWTGLFLVAAGHWPGPLTLPSLVVMVYLLAFGSGKRVLERSMSQRPGYAAYMARTSGFVPWPPKPR
ncbi:MAG TPA: DUF1295 domain-containing protein [Segeticoccus sp.]|uniref:DUF1295 domain-containing protein n=1 Tax=Segeticoccus sp. TaxID=2706531 RepID=UPI002D7EC3C4|nr:DUF1295 domain-containing protein [Segeticoccus sp.]HET8601180.1 DUF1295 domain-containing protein [Segeticoccus sp.]